MISAAHANQRTSTAHANQRTPTKSYANQRTPAAYANQRTMMVMWLTVTQINESSSGRDIGVMLMWMNSEANQPTMKNCLIVNVDVNQTTQINEPMTTQML